MRRMWLGLAAAFALAIPSAVGDDKKAFPEPPELPKASASKADEPLIEKFSFAKAAEYLDRAAVQWHRARNCAACHTTYPFLMARPLIGTATDPTLVWARSFLEARVEGWDRPRMGAGLPGQDDEATTEIVATAATLAFDDARNGKLHATTRKALDRMWTVQRKDGSWDWNKHLLPPQELDEYFGVVYAALGVGHAPDGYAKSDGAKEGVARITKYLKDNPAPNLHHQLWLLWASTKLDGLLNAEARDRIVADVLKKQRKDGGWNLPSLGDWKRHDGTANDPNADSDGYATGLVIYVLRKAGAKADDKQLQRGCDWLKANQRASGRWFTRSVSNDNAHYNTAAGTAFAVMALRECGEK